MEYTLLTSCVWWPSVVKHFYCSKSTFFIFKIKMKIKILKMINSPALSSIFKIWKWKTKIKIKTKTT